MTFTWDSYQRTSRKYWYYIRSTVFIFFYFAVNFCMGDAEHKSYISIDSLERDDVWKSCSRYKDKNKQNRFFIFMVILKAAVEWLSIVESYSRSTYLVTGRIAANGSYKFWQNNKIITVHGFVFYYYEIWNEIMKWSR